MSTPHTQITLSTLPVDLVHDNLLPLLDIPSLLSLACTSRAFSSLIASDLFWRRKLLSDLHFPVDRTARTTGFKSLYRRLTKPEVYTWGQNRNSRLGIPHDDPRIGPNSPYVNFDAVERPVRVHGEGPDGHGFVDLQAGGWSFHALDRDGKVWAWGTLNGEAWAPHGAPLDQPGTPFATPTRLPLSDHLAPIQQLSCGRSHALALAATPSRDIYEWHSWGRIARMISTEGDELPWEQNNLGNKAKAVIAGWSFSAVLCEDGRAWCWWKMSAQELAGMVLDARRRDDDGAMLLKGRPHDRTVQCPPLPKPADPVKYSKGKGKEGHKIVKLAAGDDFLIALSDESKVYRLDISPVNPPGARPAFAFNVTHNEDNATSDEEVAASRHARARLEAAFLNGNRHWELLDKFCDMAEIAKLPAFDPSSEEPSTSNSQKSTAAAAPLKPPSASARITHVSAMYNSFAVYSVTDRDEDSLVLLGSKQGTEPEVIPGLQGKGVIDVCLGDYHRGVLLSSGQLLTWGQYSAGALGLAPDDGDDGGSSSGPARPQANTRTAFVRRGLAFGRPGHSMRQTPREPVAKPTPVPMFPGAAGKMQVAIGKTGQRRFVFAASFAGWHSGCLAVTLDDDETDTPQAPPQADVTTHDIGQPPAFRAGGFGGTSRMPGSLDDAHEDDE